ncbi:unnamed protein product [Didymodactylos carnosus]|uniref:Uncharacterized protein n=1 Tax=Didymodactylos carnosus TaxID=1234261 RepID=A0A814NS93_9BILA|nr:unnamed protein product [Didymodactylos carnosus]CAF1095158.1 unnamed protein product [Didymodactylos carnosus]CAF3709129.1 unnamed protein product [Didymodactylos carnosus]CAF3860400.1 unnamed protein product [Didymodactylos carnosus]
MFDTQIQKIEQESYTYEQQCILIFLPKVFHSLVKKIRETSSFEDNNILQLADSYFQCALLYDQFSSHIKSILSYISAFSIYASKSPSEIAKLIDEMTTIINSFTANKLTPKDILELYQRLLSSEDVVEIRLKIPTMYRENETDDVVELDGDEDTSNESREIAIQWYRDCLKTTNNIWVKGVCYYNILVQYQNFIYEDSDGKDNVDDMINCLPQFNTSDRRLLIKRRKLHFLKEYEHNTGNSATNSHLQLHKFTKHPFDKKLEKNDISTIGHYLMKSNDLIGAEEYWSSIAQQLECDFAGPILPLIRNPHSTFDEILDTIKQPKNDTNALFYQLLETYGKTADYYILKAKDDQTTGTESH